MAKRPADEFEAARQATEDASVATAQAIVATAVSDETPAEAPRRVLDAKTGGKKTFEVNARNRVMQLPIVTVIHCWDEADAICATMQHFNRVPTGWNFQVKKVA